MIEREARFYTAGYDGELPEEAPLYVRSLVFDETEGDFNEELIQAFNRFLIEKNIFPEHRLIKNGTLKARPRKIIVINASQDDLPTSYETARVFSEYLEEEGMDIPVKVVNTWQDLVTELEPGPEDTLVISQCVDKKVYNKELAERMEARGIVIVPGKVTAPGGIFSDKDSTYRLLSDNGRVWDNVARYIKIDVDSRSVEDVVGHIFRALNRLAKDTGDTVFFVKPHEGGGGLGGFRITKKDGGYIIPDLSKLTGDSSGIHPTFINIDTGDAARLRELLWIYRLFGSDEKLRSNYLFVDLPVIDTDDDKAVDILKEYIEGCKEKMERKISGMVKGEKEAREELINAIKVFERKFGRRYIPLINEHIDFGLWGLRAHYRLTGAGPRLEAMYSRIFQLAFTGEGIGYLGADNISNKQTGELEALRVGPVNEIMVRSIGGREVLFNTLVKGASALTKLADTLSDQEKERLPLRVQLDLAVLSQRIGEGNADTARGLSLCSRWTEFIKNNREWLDDSLAYYNWKKRLQRI